MDLNVHISNMGRPMSGQKVGTTSQLVPTAAFGKQRAPSGKHMSFAIDTTAGDTMIQSKGCLVICK